MSLINKEIVDFKVQAFVDGEFREITKADVLGKWSVFFFYPAKVTRSALQNAASIAAMVLTTETIVADKPEKADPAAMAGAGMGGGMPV